MRLLQSVSSCEKRKGARSIRRLQRCNGAATSNTSGCLPRRGRRSRAPTGSARSRAESRGSEALMTASRPRPGAAAAGSRRSTQPLLTTSLELNRLVQPRFTSYLENARLTAPYLGFRTQRDLEWDLAVRPPFMSWRQPLALTSTPYLRAAVRMRRHAASRSASLTPSTWSKRAIALRTWRASFSGSLRSFGNANVDRDIRFCCRVLRLAINETSLDRDSSSTGQRFSFHGYLWKRR